MGQPQLPSTVLAAWGVRFKDAEAVAGIDFWLI